MIRWFRNRRHGFLGDEGTATIEFVLVIPWIMFLFFTTIESSMIMTRSLMLERSVDLTMRDLRLGHFTNPTSTLLKKEICSHGVVLGDCEASIMIEMQPVSTDTWVVPTEPTACREKPEDANPALTFGTDKEIMIVRVCLVMEAFFPAIGIGKILTGDKNGYSLVAVSAFVNEPVTG